jgi:hypothetical protein
MAQPLTAEETEALNRHGVFLKKRLIHELRNSKDIQIIGEELGFSFGGTRVLDVLALDMRSKPHVHLAFECKRVIAGEKHWIFFRDFDRSYRVARAQSSIMGHSSAYDQYRPPHPPVCSEGYEYTKKTEKADQDPVFQACAQLSAAYLGFIARRHREFHRPGVTGDTLERYVPILVTNAALFVVDSDFATVSLETGELPAAPNVSKTDYVVLKQPFPTPAGVEFDYRDFPAAPTEPKHWPQVHKETIYVVTATALRAFLAIEQRDFLRSAGSDP